jgi:hypothetical protein
VTNAPVGDWAIADIALAPRLSSERSSRLARRTGVRVFRLAIGSHRSTTALLRAAFAPLPQPNGQTEAQIIRFFHHLALMAGRLVHPPVQSLFIAGPMRRVRRRVLSAMKSEGDCTAGPESSRMLRVVASVPP